MFKYHVEFFFFNYIYFNIQILLNRKRIFVASRHLPWAMNTQKNAFVAWVSLQCLLKPP